MCLYVCVCVCVKLPMYLYLIPLEEKSLGVNILFNGLDTTQIIDFYEYIHW